MTNNTDLQKQILDILPEEGSAMGNKAMLEALEASGMVVDEDQYQAARESLLAQGVIVKGRGRGGSIARVLADGAELELKPQTAPKAEDAKVPKPAKKKAATKGTRSKSGENQVLSYRYDEKRKNNPHVGMVDTHSDGVEEEKTWRYDPHLAPELQFDSSATRNQVEQLIDNALQASQAQAEQNKEELLSWLDQALEADDETAIREVVTNLRKRVAAAKPQSGVQENLEALKRMQAPYLQWTGKAERTSFEVDTVSLHVHERIDPATILAAVQKRVKEAHKKGTIGFQSDLFSAPFENLPLREAVDFYKHERDWANRLIAGDSLLVMNSLLQKEGMAGQVQMIYIDPPYGIKYGSNFQPFTNKRDVKDRKDEDLTQEPEMIKAFRDTWELGIHSYLSYLRDRLMLAKELLHDSGSVFVQISDENLHLVRNILDDVFGTENFISQISFQKTGGISGSLLGTTVDYLLWYAKNKNEVKYRQLFMHRASGDPSLDRYNRIQLPTFYSRGLTAKEIRGEVQQPSGSRYRVQSLFSDGAGKNNEREYFWRGKRFQCPASGHWKTTPRGLDALDKAGRLEKEGERLRYRRFVNDFPVVPIHDRWESIQIGTRLTYVVQTAEKVVERCLLMTTDPGDLVLDPTCGSGTTAVVAEKRGRRWITTDTSRVAVTLTKQRLMTASYDYFELKYPQEGLRGGFIYKTVPHVTLKSIANNPEVAEIYERMHPAIKKELDELNKIAKKSFQEWEVPSEFAEVDEGALPNAARKHFDAFHLARKKMQNEMDASIAAHSGQEVLYDQPVVSKNKMRITGPFTVEAVPFATVLGLDEAEQPKEADVAVARPGATLRQSEWRDELIRAGIRGKGGQKLELVDLTPLPEAKYIHAVGTVKETGDKVAVSFGPEHATLEQRQVEIAMREAGDLFPLPKMLVFCAFTFDPEAAKDIDNIKGITALKVQMNTDLLTEDLKKGRASNESFWLMGQPEVEVLHNDDGTLTVEVHGFDYFDTKTGELKSGGKKNIAMWALDTDYDNRSLFPRQVFFPMAGNKDGWYKLKNDIRAELNEELLHNYHGTTSLPFEPGDNQCLAVKIVDDRGIESLKVIRLD